MKKLLFVLLVISVSVSMLVLGIGCKTGTTDTTTEAETPSEEAAEEEVAEEVAEEVLTTDPVKLAVIFHQPGPIIFEAHQKLIDEFEEMYPNVTIDLQIYEATDTATKIRTAITSGTQLDGFLLYSGESAWFLENDTVAEIDPSVLGMSLDEYKAQWIPGMLETTNVVYRGKMVGVPHEVSNYVSFIRKSAMERAGLDPEKDIPTTWAQAREIAKKMTVIENEVVVKAGWAQSGNTARDVYVINTMMQQKGLDWRSLEGMIAALDTPEALEVIKLYTEIITEDKSFDNALFDPSHEYLLNDVASMWFYGGSWMFGFLESSDGNAEDVIAFKFPRFEDGLDLGGLSYGYGLFISKTSENKEWMLKFFDHLTSKPEYYVDGGIQIPRASFDASVFEESSSYLEKYWHVFVEELPKGTPSIADSRTQKIEEAVLKCLSRINSEGISPEESIQMLKSYLEAMKSE